MSIIVFFSTNFSYLDMFLFLKNFCNIKYVLFAFFILSCRWIWWLLSSWSVTPKYLKFQLFQICNFLFSNVLFFVLKRFSFPLSYIYVAMQHKFVWIRGPDFSNINRCVWPLEAYKAPPKSIQTELVSPISYVTLWQDCSKCVWTCSVVSSMKEASL